MLNDLELTPTEQHVLRRTLEGRARFAHVWPWMRYILLLASLFSMSFGAYAFHMWYQLATTTGPEHLYTIRIEGMMYVSAHVFALAGVSVLIMTITQWGRHKMDIVFVKIGRTFLAARASAEDEAQPAHPADE